MADAWQTSLIARLDAARHAATVQQRGDLYAEIVRSIFESIPGVPQARTKVVNVAGSQEIDIGFWNDQHPDGFSFLPRDVTLVECKNWTQPVSSADVAWFDTKIRQRDLTFGFLFAAHGVTGSASERTAANHVVAQALAEGRRIIVVTSADLASLRSETDFIDLLKDKIVDLVLKQALVP
jgi:hypothetical protein